jgi:hypothetical protein
MKKLLFLLLLLPFISHAQPDYKKDIYIKDKRCVKHNFGNGRDIKQYGNRIYTLSQYYPGIGIPADAMLIIMNKNFDTIKTVRYGGTGTDLLTQIQQLPNGNLLLSGLTTSKDGDVWYGANYPASAAWLLEVDTNGVIKKGRCFGGYEGTSLTGLHVSKTGGIYAVGASSANDQDFLRPVPNGSLDLYIFKFDTAFNIDWKFIPHTIKADGGCRITEMPNGKMVFVFGVEDTSSLVAGNQAKGKLDLLAYCFKEDGTQLWQKRYGGSGEEGGGYVRYDSLHKKLYFLTQSSSLTGDQDIEYNTLQSVNPSNIQSYNFCIIIADTNGAVIRAKAYGVKQNHTSQNPILGFEIYNNNIWIARTLAENQIHRDDFSSDQFPVEDSVGNIWIGMIDSNANLIGKYCIKSNQYIVLQHLIEVDNKFFALGGSGNYPIMAGTNNFSCDTNQHFGFILELGEAPLGTKNYTKENKPELFTLYPNPTDNELYIKINEAYKGEKYSLDIYTLEGKRINSEKGKATIEPLKINTSNYTSGSYIVQLKLNQLKHSKTFIKK